MSIVGRCKMNTLH